MPDKHDMEFARAMQAKMDAATVGIETHGVRVDKEAVRKLEEAVEIEKEKILGELQLDALTGGFRDHNGLHLGYTNRCMGLYQRLRETLREKGLTKRIDIVNSNPVFHDAKEFDLLIVLSIFLYDTEDMALGRGDTGTGTEEFSIGIDCREGEYHLRCWIGPNPNQWFGQTADAPEELLPVELRNRAWTAERMEKAEAMLMFLIEMVESGVEPDHPLLEEEFDFGF